MSDSKRHWEAVYQAESPRRLSWYQQEPALSLQLVRRAGLAPYEPIIDVGGGSSTLVDFLIAEGFEDIAVLDISARALAQAQARLGDRAVRVEWHEADVLEFRPRREFALWHDRAVLHFLTSKSDRQRYVHAIQKALRPRGHLIIAAFAVGGPTQCSGLDIVQYDRAKLRAELGEGFCFVEALDEVHRTPAGKAQQFTYYRFERC